MLRRLASLSVWLIGPLLGLSAGFYYTLMPFGRTGVFAAPEPVTFAAALGYYVGGGQQLDEERQAVAWVLAFTFAFLLWAACIAVFARFGVFRLTRLWVAYLPLIALGIPLAYLCGKSQNGFDFQKMLDVALRREFERAPDWAAYAFIMCAIWASVSQILWLWRKIKALLIACAVLFLAISIALLLGR